MMTFAKVISYLNKIQKIYKSRDKTQEVCWYEHFLNRNYQFFLCYKIILSTFIESLKVAPTNMIPVLMLSAKTATLDRLKRKVFWNKGYDVIISVHGALTKFYQATQFI